MKNCKIHFWQIYFGQTEKILGLNGLKGQFSNTGKSPQTDHKVGGPALSASVLRSTSFKSSTSCRRSSTCKQYVLIYRDIYVNYKISIFPPRLLEKILQNCRNGNDNYLRPNACMLAPTPGTQVGYGTPGRGPDGWAWLKPGQIYIMGVESQGKWKIYTNTYWLMLFQVFEFWIQTFREKRTRFLVCKCFLFPIHNQTIQ